MMMDPKDANDNSAGIVFHQDDDEGTNVLRPIATRLATHGGPQVAAARQTQQAAKMGSGTRRPKAKRHGMPGLRKISESGSQERLQRWQERMAPRKIQIVVPSFGTAALRHSSISDSPNESPLGDVDGDGDVFWVGHATTATTSSRSSWLGGSMAPATRKGTAALSTISTARSSLAVPPCSTNASLTPSPRRSPPLSQASHTLTGVVSCDETPKPEQQPALAIPARSAYDSLTAQMDARMEHLLIKRQGAPHQHKHSSSVTERKDPTDNALSHSMISPTKRDPQRQQMLSARAPHQPQLLLCGTNASPDQDSDLDRQLRNMVTAPPATKTTATTPGLPRIQRAMPSSPSPNKPFALTPGEAFRLARRRQLLQYPTNSACKAIFRDDFGINVSDDEIVDGHADSNAGNSARQRRQKKHVDLSNQRYKRVTGQPKSRPNQTRARRLSHSVQLIGRGHPLGPADPLDDLDADRMTIDHGSILDHYPDPPSEQVTSSSELRHVTIKTEGLTVSENQQQQQQQQQRLLFTIGVAGVVEYEEYEAWIASLKSISSTSQQRIHQMIWNACQLVREFSLGKVVLRSDKLLKIATGSAPLKQFLVIACCETPTEVADTVWAPCQRYKGKNGRELATKRLQKAWRDYKLTEKKMDTAQFVSAVHIISSAWVRKLQSRQLHQSAISSSIERVRQYYGGMLAQARKTWPAIGGQGQEGIFVHFLSAGLSKRCRRDWNGYDGFCARQCVRVLDAIARGLHVVLVSPEPWSQSTAKVYDDVLAELGGALGRTPSYSVITPDLCSLFRGHSLPAATVTFYSYKTLFELKKLATSSSLSSDFAFAFPYFPSMSDLKVAEWTSLPILCPSQTMLETVTRKTCLFDFLDDQKVVSLVHAVIPAGSEEQALHHAFASLLVENLDVTQWCILYDDAVESFGHFCMNFGSILASLKYARRQRQHFSMKWVKGSDEQKSAKGRVERELMTNLTQILDTCWARRYYVHDDVSKGEVVLKHCLKHGCVLLPCIHEHHASQHPLQPITLARAFGSSMFASASTPSLFRLSHFAGESTEGFAAPSSPSNLDTTASTTAVSSTYAFDLFISPAQSSGELQGAWEKHKVGAFPEVPYTRQSDFLEADDTVERAYFEQQSEIEPTISPRDAAQRERRPSMRRQTAQSDDNDVDVSVPLDTAKLKEVHVFLSPPRKTTGAAKDNLPRAFELAQSAANALQQKGYIGHATIEIAVVSSSITTSAAVTASSPLFSATTSRRSSTIGRHRTAGRKRSSFRIPKKSMSMSMSMSMSLSTDPNANALCPVILDIIPSLSDAMAASRWIRCCRESDTHLSSSRNGRVMQPTNQTSSLFTPSPAFSATFNGFENSAVLVCPDIVDPRAGSVDLSVLHSLLRMKGGLLGAERSHGNLFLPTHPTKSTSFATLTYARTTDDVLVGARSLLAELDFELASDAYQEDGGSALSGLIALLDSLHADVDTSLPEVF